MFASIVIKLLLQNIIRKITEKKNKSGTLHRVYKLKLSLSKDQGQIYNKRLCKMHICTYVYIFGLVNYKAIHDISSHFIALFNFGK